MSTISVAHLARVFVDLADTLVDDYDIIEFLQVLATHASEISGSEAAGLLLADPDGQMSTQDAGVMQALADVATIGILQERTIRRGELVTAQLQGALNSRVIIEQAKGAIAQLYGSSIDEAFDLLRSYCRRTQQHLADVAHLIVSDPERAPNLEPPTASRRP